jgi:hypothetical protein
LRNRTVVGALVSPSRKSVSASFVTVYVLILGI